MEANVSFKLVLDSKLDKMLIEMYLFEAWVPKCCRA